MAVRLRDRRFGLPALLGLVALVGIAGWFAWRSFGPASGGPSLANASSATIQAGAAIYSQHCAACHGDDLQGQPEWRRRKPDGRLPAPPHDASGHTWHHPDAVLFGITRNGLKPPLAPDGYESDMPAYGGILSDEQIWAVLAYIGSRWPPRERDHQRRIDAAHRAAQ